MLGNAHEFKMRVAHIRDIGNQLIGGLEPIREGRDSFIPRAPPRTQMHLVGIEGLAQGINLGSAPQPRTVLPLKAVEVRHHGAIVRPQLHRERRTDPP